AAHSSTTAGTSSVSAKPRSGRTRKRSSRPGARRLKTERKRAMPASPQFTELCTNELSLCGVNEGEVVAVLSSGDERQDYADAFLQAAAGLGASTFQIRLPSGSGNVANDAGGAWAVGSTGLADNPGAV